MAFKRRKIKTAVSRSQSHNKLRVIAGIYRGRKLDFPIVAGLRPTPERVRETLFNWLGYNLEGSRCLDLFAGSGALSLEAISRGACQVVMIDYNERVAQHLLSILKTLECNNGQVIWADSLKWLNSAQSKSQTPFDVVFVDPPYGRDIVVKCCEMLEKSGLMTEKCKIYVEHEQAVDPQFPANWKQHRFKQAGKVSYSLFHRNEPT